MDNLNELIEEVEMKAQELERRYNELDADLSCVEYDIATASNAGFGHRVLGPAYDELDRISNEMSKIAGQLKAMWEKDPGSVSADFREMFEAWELEEKALAAMGF